MNFLYRVLIKVFLPFVRLYWFIFRPKTYGVKVILSKEDKVLFVKPSYSANWGFPGGGVKSGETKEEAVLRETKEEVGVGVRNLQYLGSFLSKLEYKHDNIYIFKGNVDEEIIIDNVEIVDFGWFDFKNPPKLGLVGQKILSFYEN